MATIGEVAAQIRAAMQHVADAIGNAENAREKVGAARKAAGPVAEGSVSEEPAKAIGAWRDADTALEEAIALFTAGNDTTESYLALIGAGSGGTRRTTGAGPPPPPKLASSGYPIGKPHRISWSDLDHVINGDPHDPEKGGHAHGIGRPGKTEFPATWDDETIREALVTVAGAPEKTDAKRNGKYIATGVYLGRTVQAVVRTDGSIEAGWPVQGPGVRRNPSVKRR